MMRSSPLLERRILYHPDSVFSWRPEPSLSESGLGRFPVSRLLASVVGESVPGHNFRTLRALAGGKTFSGYCPIELAVAENTLFALPPINRSVPTTITKMTASITAYSAISCPLLATTACQDNQSHSHLRDASILYLRVPLLSPTLRFSEKAVNPNRFGVKHSLLAGRT